MLSVVYFCFMVKYFFAQFEIPKLRVSLEWLLHGTEKGGNFDKKKSKLFQIYLYNVSVTVLKRYMEALKKKMNYCYHF